MKLVSDSMLLFSRSLSGTLRQPVWPIMGLFQPVCYILLFSPLFAGMAASAGIGGDNAMNVFVPGILVLLGMVSAIFGGFNVISDLRSGLIERLYVTPVNRLALLIGSILNDIVVLLLQGIIIVLLALPFGLQPNLPGILLSLLLLVIMGVMVASASYTLGLLFREENAVASISQFLVIPMLILSGLLLPLTFAPGWMQIMALFNPFAHAVEAMRALFAGNYTDVAVWRGFLVLTTLMVLSVTMATRSFSKITD